MTKHTPYLDYALEATGLKPSLSICMSPEFSREDLKSWLFEQGLGVTRNGFTTPLELACKICGITADKILNAISRQHIYRWLFYDKKLYLSLPLLHQQMRQKSFFKNFDHALQDGRALYAHYEEYQVLQERLHEVRGFKKLAHEMEIFNLHWEAWLMASGSFDPPFVLKCATEKLLQGLAQDSLDFPEKIWVIDIKSFAPYEKNFFDHVGRLIPVIQEPFIPKMVEYAHPLEVAAFPTYHDAAESIAEMLSKLDPASYERCAVVLADAPELRGALHRALKRYGITYRDPRDPTVMKFSERLKVALLPAAMVAQNFPVALVVGWIQAHQDPALLAWVPKIYDAGILHGVKSYTCLQAAPLDAKLSLHSLQVFADALDGKKTLKDFEQGFFQCLTMYLDTYHDAKLLHFLQQVYHAFVEDLLRTQTETKKARWSYWYPHLYQRLLQTAPPIETLRAQQGIQQYRLTQATCLDWDYVWILGCDADFLSPQPSPTLWFSQFDKSILSQDFELHDPLEQQNYRLALLNRWRQSSQKCYFWTATPAKSLTSSLDPLKSVMQMMQTAWGMHTVSPLMLKPSHKRFLPSQKGFTIKTKPHVHLSPSALPQAITTSAIERMSRCPLTALIFDRWKLYDIRRSSWFLTPQGRGKILHRCVKKICSHPQPIPLQRLEDILRTELQKAVGLYKNALVASLEFKKLLGILIKFCDKETHYLQHAHVRTLSLDEHTLSRSSQGATVIGRPDRVDLTEDGRLFLIEYKASSDLPNAYDMVHYGYRLQMATYAWLASHHWKKPIAGCQVIGLDENGSRGYGVFYPDDNRSGTQKETYLTEVRKNSKSLIGQEAMWESTWQNLYAAIENTIAMYQKGVFRAEPNAARGMAECYFCRAYDVCARGRHGF